MKRSISYLFIFLLNFSYIFAQQTTETNDIEYVDLGLSVYWGTKNIGAEISHEMGTRFSWGEIIKDKNYIIWDDYVYCKTGGGKAINGKYVFEGELSKYNTQSKYGDVDNKTELEWFDDIAYIHFYDANGRIPTKDEFQELIDKCNWSLTTVDNVIGYKINGKGKYKSNYIFLPFKDLEFEKSFAANIWDHVEDVWIKMILDSGDYDLEQLDYHVVTGKFDEYWSKTLNKDKPYCAYTLHIDENRKVVREMPRVHGNMIRPVFEKPVVNLKNVQGIENGHEYVDLGLSVKWATCNVGALKPYESGNYYAWGEINTKKKYDFASYSFRLSGKKYSNIKFKRYNTDSKYGIVDNKCILNLTDDVANVSWGGGWRMPTEAEFQELIDNCNIISYVEGGIDGIIFQSKIKGYTDRFIFLPFAGYHFDKELIYYRQFGCYWSNSIVTLKPNLAYILSIGDNGVKIQGDTRRRGNTIRPVCK